MSEQPRGTCDFCGLDRALRVRDGAVRAHVANLGAGAMPGRLTRCPGSGMPPRASEAQQADVERQHLREELHRSLIESERATLRSVEAMRASGRHLIEIADDMERDALHRLRELGA